MYLVAVMFITTNPAINTFNMLSLHSSLIFLRTPKLFCLLGLIYLLQVSGLPLEVEAATDKPSITKQKSEKTLFETLKSNSWANVKGFRSAKFGMNEKNVYKAVAKDFKISKSKVKITTATKGTNGVMEIVVPNLFTTGGTAKVGYIFGVKSKKLIHINVLWGQGASEEVDAMNIINTANLLRTHFLKKRYMEKSLIANGKVSNNTTMVFRGRDKNNKMITLMLNTQKQMQGQSAQEAAKNTSLVLSYISNPDKPDVQDER